MLFPICLFSQVKYELKCNKELLLKSREICISQVGIKEATGRNDGKEVESYLASVGLSKGFPYCAAGQYYCFLKASEILKLDKSEIPIYRTGSTLKMFNEAIKNKKRVKYLAKIDDLLFWILPNRSGGHVERIDSVLKSGWVKTIGFNTSSGTGNQRDGEGVYLRKRNIYHILSRMKVRGLIGFKTYE